MGMLFVSIVQAQSSAPADRPDPLDARAAVPAVQHRSAFGAYRPISEVKVGSWRDANDTVNRVGGWRVYAREAAQPEAAPNPAIAPAPGAVPASAPGRPAGGHGPHGKP